VNKTVVAAQLANCICFMLITAASSCVSTNKNYIFNLFNELA